tara:strand:- start:759 stop:878 length:120 start_codon:yes stop_codon:yes gene_type:complete
MAYSIWKSILQEIIANNRQQKRARWTLKSHQDARVFGGH